MNLFCKLSKAGAPILDRLFAIASDIDIYCELMEEEVEIGIPTYSPLRLDDHDPSFSLFIPTKIENIRPDEVWWRDFKGSSGNVFEFTKRYAKLHYDLELTSYYAIVQFLDGIMHLGIFSDTEVEYHRRTIDYEKAKQPKIILYTARPFTIYDDIWWLERCIDNPLLTDHRVASVKYLLDELHNIKYRVGATEKVYTMSVMNKLKVYCPESKDFKWRSTCTSNHIFGAAQCKGNRPLIITKSLKDIMTFKSFMNVDAISPQGEGNTWDEKFINFLKSKYSIIMVVMDYDPAGIEAAERLAAFGLPIRYVDTKQEEIDGKLTVKDKDISDYAYYHGPHATLDHLKKMFPEFPTKVFREERPAYLEQLLKQTKDKLNTNDYDSTTGQELDDILY